MDEHFASSVCTDTHRTPLLLSCPRGCRASPRIPLRRTHSRVSVPHRCQPPSPACRPLSAKPGNPVTAFIPSPALASQPGAHTVQLLTVALRGLGIKVLTLKKARYPTPFPSFSLTSRPFHLTAGTSFLLLHNKLLPT